MAASYSLAPQGTNALSLVVLSGLSGLCCADLRHISQYEAAKRIYSTMMAKEMALLTTEWCQKFLISAIPLMVKAGPRDAALAIQLSMIVHNMDIKTLARRLNISHVTNLRLSLVFWHLIWFFCLLLVGVFVMP